MTMLTSEAFSSRSDKSSRTPITGTTLDGKSVLRVLPSCSERTRVSIDTLGYLATRASSTAEPMLPEPPMLRGLQVSDFARSSALPSARFAYNRIRGAILTVFADICENPRCLDRKQAFDAKTLENSPNVSRKTCSVSKRIQTKSKKIAYHPEVLFIRRILRVTGRQLHREAQHGQTELNCISCSAFDNELRPKLPNVIHQTV